MNVCFAINFLNSFAHLKYDTHFFIINCQFSNESIQRNSIIIINQYTIICVIFLGIGRG